MVPHGGKPIFHRPSTDILFCTLSPESPPGMREGQIRVKLFVHVILQGIYFMEVLPETVLYLWLTLLNG